MNEKSQKKSGIIFGKYKLLDLIGSGSFGSVYQAQNIQTNEKYAVKLVNFKIKKNRNPIIVITNIIYLKKKAEFCIL